MAEYILGEIDSKEIERLEHMAPLTADFIFKEFKCHSGMRMLDLGCGIGAMTHQLFNRFPGIDLYGVDIQLQSLRVAQARHPIACYTLAGPPVFQPADMRAVSMDCPFGICKKRCHTPLHF